MSIKPVYIESFSFRGSDDAVVGVPLAARQRGRTSVLCKLLLDVMDDASTQSNLDRVNTPVVVGSALGDMAATQMLLQSIAVDEDVSPIRFQHSVHNTVCGLWSIACGQTASATAIAAGYDTLPMAILEAYGQLQYNDAVLVAVGDEAASGPLYDACDYGNMACAFVLTREPTASATAVLVSCEGAGDDVLPFVQNPCVYINQLKQMHERHTWGPMRFEKWCLTWEIYDV